MKFFKKIFESITYPFKAFAVLVDETRRQNLDGKWDKYWERKNRREMKKAASRKG